jgi:hypothetical protein
MGELLATGFYATVCWIFARVLLRFTVKMYLLSKTDDSDDGTLFTFSTMAFIVVVVFAVVYTGKLLELLGG